MPYKPTSSSAQHALDEVQVLAANKQYSWTSGCDASLSSSTTAIETSLTSGTVIFDGEQIDVASQTLSHPDGDTNDPRWDALCVTDRTGAVEVFTGVPYPLQTDEQGNPLRGEQAFAPAPSDNITTEMVCLALVWIPSGATTNDDLTDTSNGGVANPVVDRRVYQQGQVTQATRRATITSSGWYTIASQAPLGTGPETTLRLANALFTVRDTQSGRNSTTTFWASHLDAEQPTIQVINSAAGSRPRAIQGVRIVSGTTESDNGAEVQVNVQLNTNSQVSIVEYTLQNNYHYSGWHPESWQSGVVPSGYDTTDVYWKNPDYVFASSTDGSNTARFTVDRDGQVSGKRFSPDEKAINVSLTSNVSISSGGDAEIPYDGVRGNDLGGYNASTGHFTVPYNGWYTVIASAMWSGHSGGDQVTLDVRSGSSIFSRDLSVAVNNKRITQITHVTKQLNGGADLHVGATHDSSNNLTVVGNGLGSHMGIIYNG